MTPSAPGEVRLERLTIRCRAASADQDRALAVRARLCRLAAERLPAVLGRALGGAPGTADAGAGLPDLRVDRLVVPLGFDPADHDDDTVVLLWAEHIRAAVTHRLSAAVTVGAARRPEPPCGDPPVICPAPPGEPAHAAPDGPHATAGPGMAGPTPGGPAWPERAPATLPEEDDEPWPRLTDDLRPAVPAAPEASAGPDDDADGPSPAGPVGEGPPSPPLPRASAAVPAGLAPTARQTRASEAAPGEAVRAAAPATVRAALPRTGRPAALTGTLPSRAGGLVLLYPWLTGYAHEAASLLRRAGPATLAAVAEADLRRIALAALADPTDPALRGDPLVVLLAGASRAPQPLPADGESARGAVTDEVSGAAEAVLREFAAALPGFERSSAAYLRAGFLIREAAWEAEPGGALRVDLARLPLDPVLVRLPYPVDSFTLPWSPPVRVTLAGGPVPSPTSPEA